MAVEPTPTVPIHPSLRLSLLDRRLGRVVVESNRATVSKKAGTLDPDTALSRTMPGLGLPQPGFWLQGSMSSAQE
jgi:hypothetical protein